MEPYGSIKAEAQRWLGIAVKLLSVRDLVGSKTFAIRAKDSDHRLELADQILAVADTLIAADKRINNQHDWYAILHIVGRTHDSDLIVTQYNRLTHLLNPRQNNLPFADLAFKSVCDAWIVLSNPSSKSVYDSEINFLSVVNNNQAGLNREQEYHEQQYFNRHHQNQQWQQQPPPLVRPVPYQPLPSRSVAKQPPRSRPVPQQLVHSRPEPQNQQPMQRVQEPGVRKSPRKVVDNTPVEVDVGLDNNNGGNVDEYDAFWTTCPYCFNMYEYPRVYVDCTLRCQNCKRAFQAISIPMRPPVIEGKEAYFSCWGFFPLAITESNSQKKKDKSSAKWTPFSPLFTLRQTVENANAGSSDYVNVQNVNAGSSDYVNATVPADKSPAPRVYVDIEDDDAYLDDLEGDDDTDDDDWGRSTTRRKRAKRARGKTSSVGRPRKQSQSDKAKNIKANAGSESSQGALAMKESLQAPKVAMAETSKKTVAINTRRQSGRGAKEMGKLDLNVEFSNEVEEHAPASSAGNQNGGAGHREEDNIEGMFFEGLDEFLSNLPILVGDDKKAA